MPGYTPFHHQIGDLYFKIISKGRHIRTSHERHANGRYEQIRNAEDSFILPQEIAIVDLTIYDDLPLSAIKLLIRIQKELRMNNPLWECNSKRLSEVKRGLARLREKEIIYPIFGTDMYIVNPEKIRRGKPLGILISLYVYSKERYDADKRWRISNVDIRRLTAPDDLSLLVYEMQS